MKNEEEFKEYYSKWFKSFSAAELVKYEQNLSKFIDSDLFDDSLLSDEAIILFELLRDECVSRVAKLAECPLELAMRTPLGA